MTSRLHAGRCLALAGLASVALLIGSETLQTAIANGDTRALTLRHSHREDDTVTITFKRNGKYDQDGLKKLNHFLRDWRTDDETEMDPHLFDVVWEVYREVGGKEPIHIISAYRSPATNAMLRRRSRGVAQFSQHMLGKAMDFHIPGVALEELRYAGLRLQRGGVGFYPSSGSPFVHIDTGSVRHWPRMAPEMLARVMSKGPVTRLASADKPARYTPPPAADEDDETIARPVASRMPVRRPAAEPKPQPNAVAIAPQAAQQAFALASAGSTPFPLAAARKPAPAPAAAPPADTTASVRTWLDDVEQRPGSNDRVSPELALAYAAAALPDQSATRAAIAPSPRIAPPATTQVPKTPGKPVVQPRPGQRFNDPWMRSVTLAASVHYSSVTVYGQLDIRGIQTLMQKPAASLDLAFRADPYDGMTSVRFNGPAVAFLPVRSFVAPQRHAGLQ